MFTNANSARVAMPFARRAHPYVVAVILAGLTSGGSTTALRAQAATRTVASVREDTIAPGVSVLRTPRGNALVRVTPREVFVVGVADRRVTDALRARLAGRTARWAALFYSDSAVTDAEAGWNALGVTTIAHESLRGMLAARARDTAAPARPRVPTLGFSEVMQISLDGDEVHLIHQPRAFSGSDVVAHLEGANILVLGPLFASDGYPPLSAGARFAGLVNVVSTFARVFGDRADMRIVPGTGPVANGPRLVAYRDMLVQVQQRLRAALARGATEDAVAGSGMLADLDPAWGHGAVTGEAFLRAAYRSLKSEPSSGAAGPGGAGGSGERP